MEEITSLTLFFSRSIEHELKEVLNEAISSSLVLGEFAEVWKRIGLNVAQRQVRRETMAIHVGSLLKDILQEEQELEKSMIASLHANEKELTSLCQQLGLPEEKVSDQYS